jgi:hypothetical protein
MIQKTTTYIITMKISSLANSTNIYYSFQKTVIIPFVFQNIKDDDIFVVLRRKTYGPMEDEVGNFEHFITRKSFIHKIMKT